MMKSRVAIVHYWLVTMRGGERVVEALAELFPQAELFTHVCDPAALSDALQQRSYKTTFIQRLPGAKRYYRNYLPLMPLALEQLDLSQYDLVISSESGPAKGVLTSAKTLHLCYCHTPMRYLWDMYHDYRKDAGIIKRLLMPPLCNYLRQWDCASAARVDAFVANSRNVAARIRKTYRREATVIHPPVDVGRFRHDRPREDFYLTVSQLVGYKRIDLIVNAFSKLNRPLIVIGDGPELSRLRRRAAKNIQFLGHQSDASVADHLERCKAFVFAANEDFGIAPVEAQAAGAPVIAYGEGGSTETVVPNVTGLFFDEQSEDSLLDALHQFEAGPPLASSTYLRDHAQKFSRRRFLSEFKEYAERAWEHHVAQLRNPS